MSTKPTMLLIRHPLAGGELQRGWEDAYCKAFRSHFEVVIIEEDCDLDALCERTRPDLIAFRGAHSAPHRRIHVKNALTCAEVPRVGLYFGDGFCTSRPSFFYDMESWGVETYFTQTFYLTEHTPEAASRTFVLPQTFDDAIFRDYGEEKVIPFVVFGELAPWRPWRVQTAMALLGRYPTMVCPHPGYGPTPAVGMAWIGEPYARALNRAVFSICDGSIFNCVLRKHVEIPASGAILISQPIDGLKEYGFVDMANCIIGAGEELMAKIAAVVADPARQRSIARAGYELVHDRHAAHKCDQLYRWFLLRRKLRAGESIIQHGTFGDFEIVRDGRSGAIPPIPMQPNEPAILVAKAEKDYRDGLLIRCIKTLDNVLEMQVAHAPARLLMVRALLMSGRVQEAAQHGAWLFGQGKYAYQAPEPDPVEWAWWAIIHLCRGDVSGAAAALRTFPALRHSEVRRVAWLVDALQGRAGPLSDGRRSDDRPSVAVSLQPSHTAWLAEIEALLRKCGQIGLANAVSTLRLGQPTAVPS